MATPVVPMTGTDTVLWSIERDRLLRSTVTAVLLLDRTPDFDLLRRRIERTVAYFPRLAQHVVEPRLGLGRPRWVDDPAFDLDYHLRVVAAPAERPRWLMDFAATFAAAGFDRDRPLWEMVLVEGLEHKGAAIVLKLHHAMSDGVGAVELLASVVDFTRHPRREVEPKAAPAPAPPAIPVTPLFGRDTAELARIGRETVDRARHRTARLFGAADPPALLARMLDTGASVWRVLAPATDRLSPAFSGMSTRWRFDIHEVSLDALHDAAKSVGASVNDAFVAAVTGGLHRYHHKLGHEVGALRINLPVSFRHPGDPLGSNRFTPVRFVLPVAELDPAARIRTMRNRCHRAITEPALPLADAIASVLSMLPAPVTTAVRGSLLKGLDFVATNIPGISTRCFIAGAEVVRAFSFAPLSGAAVNVALLSLNGRACIGVNMDRDAVEDPDLLMACLVDSFDEITSVGTAS